MSLNNSVAAEPFPALSDEFVQLPDGPRLAIRRAHGAGRPFLLVHGLASNARLWDGVARRLAAAGHDVVAVDQRGHGQSEVTAAGYDTATAAADLNALCQELGWTGDRAPIVAGQSWGGNVAVTFAAEYGGAAGLALVDGGWIYLADRFKDFDSCWAALAPPIFENVTEQDLMRRAASWNADWPQEGREGALGNFGVDDDGFVYLHLSRDHHRSIVYSLWADDPRLLYPKITVPTLLMPAVSAVPDSAPAIDAANAIANSRMRWYVGAHHDLHAQRPAECANDLLELAAAADGATFAEGGHTWAR